MSHTYALAVHGGAGRWSEDRVPFALEGVRRAAEVARRILAGGGTALDAVVEAVAVLEDDPLFNAGTGSALNAAGAAEMDAAVASGARFGAVAALGGVRNPVRVARKVMEETDHLLLAGDGAERFARAMGFASHDPVTAERRAEYLKWRDEHCLQDGDPLPRLRGLLERHPELAGGTVGAVARDRDGGLAAATSTGGLFRKLPGRVGDTPLPGAGTFASAHAAASATGHGEIILRYLATRHACALAAAGAPAGDAVEQALAALEPRGHAGMILVDAAGHVGIAHDTPFMPHAWGREDLDILAASRAETPSA